MILKLYFANSTRRVEFVDDTNQDGAFMRLTEFLERTFQLHLGFAVRYKDDEGDLCNITGDLALREALRLYPHVLKLNIDAHLDDNDLGFVMVNERELAEGWELLHGDDLNEITQTSSDSLLSPVLPSLPLTSATQASIKSAQSNSITQAESQLTLTPLLLSEPTVTLTTKLTTSSPPPILLPKLMSSPTVKLSVMSPKPVNPNLLSATAQKQDKDLHSDKIASKTETKTEKPASPALLPLPSNLDALLGFSAVPVDKILWQYGRYRVKISGDGDCAFASIAQQLAASGGGSFTVNDLRQIFCDEITSNFSQWSLYFPGTSSAEINKFRSKGHWDSDLGDAVIIVLCLMFQVDCTIYRHDRRVVHSWSSDGAGKSPMLHLAHHCAHFDSTRPLINLASKAA